jgi:phosphoribulokinase
LFYEGPFRSKIYKEKGIDRECSIINLFSVRIEGLSIVEHFYLYLKTGKLKKKHYLKDISAAVNIEKSKM